MKIVEEKYISETLLGDKPKKRLSLVLKDGCVNSDKVFDKSFGGSQSEYNQYLRDRLNSTDKAEAIPLSEITEDNLSEPSYFPMK